MGSDKPSKADEERAERIATDICFGKFKSVEWRSDEERALVVGAMAHAALDGIREGRGEIGNLLDHWDQVPNDIKTDPGIERVAQILNRLAETKG